jgi:putative GTP pyrophosphokinase
MELIDYLSEENIAKAGTTRAELEAIKQDFKSKSHRYEQAAKGITDILLKTPGVHSVRYRIKDPEHLMEKVVRKRLENKDRDITVANYEEQLTDLAGVRILHLFKGDWQYIHQFIIDTWGLHENPTAYYRKGDSNEILGMFTSQKCEVKEHPAGYRSVHYIAQTSLTRSICNVEIQVRTIFEEGWSEVDHKIRYPNFSNNALTNDLLMMLNRSAGSADEMSSFVQGLSLYIKQSEQEQQALKQERDDLTAKLNEVMKNPAISAHEKSNLEQVAKVINNTGRVTGSVSEHLLRMFKASQAAESHTMDMISSFYTSHDEYKHYPEGRSSGPEE